MSRNTVRTNSSRMPSGHFPSPAHKLRAAIGGGVSLLLMEAVGVGGGRGADYHLFDSTRWLTARYEEDKRFGQQPVYWTYYY